MSEKLTVVIWASIFGTGARDEIKIEIDKLDYDNAKDKNDFLNKLHDEFISEIVSSGVYIN